MSKTAKRLFHQFQPHNYSVEVWAKPGSAVFRGKVVISGKRVGRPSQRITFHQKYLTVTAAYITHHSKKEQQQIVVDRINTHGAYDELRLHTSVPLRPGEYEITLEFHGKVTPQMQGIYPCTYLKGRDTKSLIATQFESHHAREAFPCIDEPEAKATYQVSIHTIPGAQVLSNMPVHEQTKDEHEQCVVFETTPKMSSYLLAFAIGDFVQTSTTSQHGVVVTAYAPDNHSPQRLTFAAEVAAKTLDFLDDYFDTPYPLPKCDLIALPDFAAGAMENWGCVTFRESALLYDPETSDLSAKQYVAEVVVHELAHQWFGNLVTMKWWNDLWLNEGFASWVPYMVLDHLFPDWKMHEQFVAADLTNALRADSLEHTHPIVVAVNNPSEIRTIFDAISYDKGCSVISLVHDYIGEDAFKQGLRIYMKRHAYGNTETHDLWKALSEASGKDIASFMHAWTTQAGYPIIVLDPDGKHASQERFYINPMAHKTTSHWPIPLLRSADDREIMDKPAQIIEDATKLNQGKRGLYRLAFAADQYDTLAARLQDSATSTADCIGILSDATETAKAGYTSSTQVLKLYEATAASRHEENSIGMILSELGTIRRVHPATHDPMKPYMRAIISPHLQRLGIEKPTNTEPVDNELLRPSILSAAAFAGEPTVLKWAENIWQSATTPEKLRPDTRAIIYGHAVRTHNNEQAYDKLLVWYSETNLPGERGVLASALTSFADKGLFERSLSLIDSPQVKLQDALTWVIYALMNRHHKQAAWEWLKSHWDWVLTNFGNDMELSYFIRYAAVAFSDAEHAADYRSFFAHAAAPGAERPIKQGIETLQWQVAWRERDELALRDYLHDFDAKL